MTRPETASPFEAFASVARRHPRNDFLLVPASAAAAYAAGDVALAYGEALAAVEALREAYGAAGVGAGTRVALMLENRPAYFLHWLALNALGASVVPLNPELRPAELAWMFGHSEAALAVGLREHLPALEAAAAQSGGGIAVVDTAVVEGGSAPRLARPGAARRVQLGDECALMYTSGTTGKPKGCLLANEYFLMMGQRYVDRRGYVELDFGRSRVLTPLPLFHMNAMAGSTMGVILSASCVIQLDRFHPRTWWQDVARTRATGIHCLGVMPAMLLGLPVCPEERAHCVRYGTAANVEPQHHAAFEARFGFPLIEGWAMTETGAGAAISADAEPRHPGTRCIGRPTTTMQYRIVDEGGADVAKGEAGELLVRHAGPDPRRGFFSGYLKDTAATEAGWAGGWWHTGDVVCEWPDASLHFVDRLKNVIRRSGENIAALEVEQALRGHPAVAQLAVTGVPDATRGEEVFACIVPRERGAGAAHAREIFDWARERLAYFKCPGWIAFVDELPVTATQKLQRGALRELAAHLAGGPSCHDLRAFKRRNPDPVPRTESHP